MTGRSRPREGTSLEQIRRVLAVVRCCPDRGSVLPHTRQPECGCAERTECRATAEAARDGVTLEECIRCRCQSLGIT
jgi:hypothetical protein